MKNHIANLIFGMHFFIVALWCGLLLVPTSWWPERISFHFYFSLLIVVHQFIWGFLITPWTGKYRMVCILTTINQFLKGQKISDPENYDYSFAQNFLERTGITISHRRITIFTFIILTIVSIQYLFFTG